MTIDQALRLLGYACFAACLAVVWVIAPLYAPRLSELDTKSAEQCMDMKGVPTFGDYGGVMDCIFRGDRQ